MERTGAQEVVVSEHDILDGIAWSIAVSAKATAGRCERGSGVRSARAPGGAPLRVRSVGTPTRQG